MSAKQSFVHFIVLILICSTKDYHTLGIDESTTVSPENLSESETLSEALKIINGDNATALAGSKVSESAKKHPEENGVDGDTVLTDTTESEAEEKVLKISETTSESDNENELPNTTDSENIKKALDLILSENENSLKGTAESESHKQTLGGNNTDDGYLEVIKQGLKVADTESENVSPAMSIKENTAYSHSNLKSKKVFSTIEIESQPIVVVVVACETRLYQTLNLIKSALIFTQTELNFVIFTDEYIEEITEELLTWKTNVNDISFRFTVRNMGPLDINTAYLSEQFRKCGAQKLFLPILLPTLDLVLYVESDSLLLGPVEELWALFSQFDNSQIAAMSRDPKVEATTILMSLKRMREFDWPYIVQNILPQWKLRVYLCGHDIMNIIFNHHRDAVMSLPCIYNYHTQMCDSESICPEARSNRILLLHSIRHADTTVDDEDPVYKVIENNLREFQIGVQEKEIFHFKLMPNLTRINDSACASVMKAFMGETRHLNPIHINTEERIVIAVIGCGNLRRPLGVIKSALIFTKSPLYFVIFVEAAFKKTLVKVLLNWKKLTYNDQIEFEVHSNNSTYSNKYKDTWMNKDKKCTIQKLFLPGILTYIDSLIYIDENALFLGPVDDMWKMFKQFNIESIAAMAKDHYIPEFAFFPFSKQTPYFKDTGLNSDVMLMNLTRMRQRKWEALVDKAYEDYKVSSLILGDQVNVPRGPNSGLSVDKVGNLRKLTALIQRLQIKQKRNRVFAIINIIFNESLDAATVLPCRFNFRSYLCDKDDKKQSICEDVLEFGANVLIDEFYNTESLYGKSFYMIYRAIDEFTVGEDTRMLPGVMKSYVSNIPSLSSCAAFIEATIKILSQTLLLHRNS